MRVSLEKYLFCFIEIKYSKDKSIMRYLWEKRKIVGNTNV